ncbi:MAG: FeoB-associated Cys-rich membrane protein [Thermoflexaceae bacterium]|nr:FeoB-associated Cys-rich membrane protein [Thermoflexaceae bacterium]
MATLIVGVILIGMIALILRSMIRDKKNGKSLQCGGDCGKCGGHCH